MARKRRCYGYLGTCLLVLRAFAAPVPDDNPNPDQINFKYVSGIYPRAIMTVNPAALPKPGSEQQQTQKSGDQVIASRAAQDFYGIGNILGWKASDGPSLEVKVVANGCGNTQIDRYWWANGMSPASATYKSMMQELSTQDATTRSYFTPNLKEGAFEVAQKYVEGLNALYKWGNRSTPSAPPSNGQSRYNAFGQFPSQDLQLHIFSYSCDSPMGFSVRQKSFENNTASVEPRALGTAALVVVGQMLSLITHAIDQAKISNYEISTNMLTAFWLALSAVRSLYNLALFTLRSTIVPGDPKIDIPSDDEIKLGLAYLGAGQVGSPGSQFMTKDNMDSFIKDPNSPWVNWFA